MATAPQVQPDPDLQTCLQYLRAAWVHRAVALARQDGADLRRMQARSGNLLGKVFYRLGHFEPALEILELALRDAGDEVPRRAQIQGGRALAQGGMGHHDEAIAEAEQALMLAPQSASLHHVLGFVLYFAGRVSDAIVPIQKALEIGP